MDFYAFLKIGFSERIRALISNGIYAVEYDKKNKWALAPNKIIICPL